MGIEGPTGGTTKRPLLKRSFSIIMMLYCLDITRPTSCAYSGWIALSCYHLKCVGWVTIGACVKHENSNTESGRAVVRDVILLHIRKVPAWRSFCYKSGNGRPES